MKNLDAIDIANFLPHRAPLLMVNNVLALDNSMVQTSFEITSDCIFVENNTFTEVGLIENAAQTCSAIVGSSFFDDDDIEGKKTKLIGFISAIKKVVVKAVPKVGETIVSKANLKSRFDAEGYSICTLECIVHEGQQELLSCEMNLFIQEL